MKFKEIFKSKLKEGDFLWRYLDLHKLIDLAITGELHFTRTDQFPDPFEGVTYKLIADRYFAQKSNITNPLIDEAYRIQHNEKNRATLIEYDSESSIKQKTQFINCWIRSKRESIAMWNLYSNPDSVCLKIKPNDLIDYLRKNIKTQTEFNPKFQFICGSVKYYRLNPLDPFEKKTLPKYSSFKKDVAYDFEKEFRLLIATPTSMSSSNPNFIRLKFSKEFIQLFEIICHPEMENWKFENIKSLCKTFDLQAPSKSKTEVRI